MNRLLRCCYKTLRLSFNLSQVENQNNLILFKDNNKSDRAIQSEAKLKNFYKLSQDLKALIKVYHKSV